MDICIKVFLINWILLIFASKIDSYFKYDFSEIHENIQTICGGWLLSSIIISTAWFICIIIKL